MKKKVVTRGRSITLSELGEAIKNSKPNEDRVFFKGYTIGNEDVWKFLQALKNIPGFVGGSSELKYCIKQWFDTYEDLILGKDNAFLSFDEVWLQCQGLFDKIDYPKGFLMKEILKAAKKYTPPETRLWTDGKLILLISACYQLQLHTKDKPFYLSGRQAGKLVGKSQPWGFQMLKGLVKLGILEIVKPGTSYRSTRYQYVGGETSD